eukprot:CAMPEP_0197515140 /NCGR_PEP_ID=MMETSP1318-20131121/354_1 /TAXON_ID=552666 /ORGANISM="Partenskyella glossopodia, Strain RCC365" /LENGTH=175 /DNA_ID=CAMNT_0043063423 /DNA_START=211 /DNA_END=738 /DNA_ORIENTATION=-
MKKKSSKKDKKERKKHDKKKKKKKKKKKHKHADREQVRSTEQSAEKEARGPTAAAAKTAKAAAAKTATAAAAKTATAPPPTGPTRAATSKKRKVYGMMRPEEAKMIEEEGQKIRRVWDPDLGVHRLQRLNGEIVEECVSYAQQRNLIVQKSRYISPKQYTGKDKFPSEHPWFGYK